MEAGGECRIKIPVITFDSPEEEREEADDGEGEGAGSEDDPAPRQLPTTDQNQEAQLWSDSTTLEGPDPDREHLSLQLTNDNTPSPQLTNDNSSSGIDVHSHPDETDPPDLNVDSEGFLRLPPAFGRYGPGEGLTYEASAWTVGKTLCYCQTAPRTQ